MKKRFKIIFTATAIIIFGMTAYFNRSYFTHKADQITDSLIVNTANVSYKDISGKTNSWQSNVAQTLIIVDPDLRQDTLPAGSFSTGWNLMAFPQIDQDSDRLFIPNTYTVKVYDPVGNEYVEPVTLALGKGYWMKVVDDISGLKDMNYDARQSDSASSNVTKGWNLLGNPLAFNLPMSNMKVVMKNGLTKSISKAKNDGDVMDYAWSYERSNKAYTFVSLNLNKYKTSAKKQDFISPYRGFWFYVKSDNVASINMSK